MYSADGGPHLDKEFFSQQVNRVAVVYLAREAEGIEPVEKFVKSYIANPAGIAHDLLVVFKGSENEQYASSTRKLFDGISHTDVIVGDEGFDIGVYLDISRSAKQQFICFLNTFSEIAVSGWLSLLLEHAERPGVGIVGATGSFESIRDTIDFVAKAAWLCLEEGIPFDPYLAWQFEWIFRLYVADWLEEAPRSLRKKAANFIRSRFGKFPSEGSPEVWRAHWRRVTKYGGNLSEWLDRFPAFPNPHIRSNAFMIRPSTVRELNLEIPKTKQAAMCFESGKIGLTSLIRQAGLSALVVGNNGQAYEVLDWAESNTFRLGKQSNLLIFDNQTRNFEAMSEGTKLTHSRVTWGDYAGPAPSAYRDLGFRFARNDAALEPLPLAEPHGFQRFNSVGPVKAGQENDQT
jgi:hypothetical protein